MSRSRCTRAAVAAAVLWATMPPLAFGHEADHRAGALAGYVSRELMERPVSLTDAAGHLHQKVSTESAEAQGYYDQGIAYLASYVWIEAARSFYEALRRDPSLAMAHLGLAKAYFGADAPEDARVHLQKAEELAGRGKATPREVKWIALGSMQMDAVFAAPEERAARHQQYELAIEDLIAMDPADAHAWVLRGNAEEPEAWGRGQFGGVASIAFYETALRRDPGHLGAHHFLAHSYENIGEYDLAAEHARRYAAAASGVPHAQHMYGHVLPRLGRWKEALAQFEKADRLHRDYCRAQGIDPEEDWHYGHNLQLLGTVQLRVGNDREAERLFRNAFDLDMRGRFEGFYAAPLVEYLLLRDRNQEALQAAEKLERRGSPTDRMIGAALGGEALLALNRVDEARKASERAKTAQQDFVAAMRNSAFELGAPVFAEVYVDTLEGEIALRGEDPAAGEAMLTDLANRLAASPRLDSWAFGLFRLQRMAADARRAGRPRLAAALDERVEQIEAGEGKTRIKRQKAEGKNGE